MKGTRRPHSMRSGWLRITSGSPTKWSLSMKLTRRRNGEAAEADMILLLGQTYLPEETLQVVVAVILDENAPFVLAVVDFDAGGKMLL